MSFRFINCSALIYSAFGNLFYIILWVVIFTQADLAHSDIPPSKADVVIIGAGLSGLNAAFELKKAGLSYHLLELTPRMGGRVRTVKYTYEGEEIWADSGMEEYWESNPAIKVMQELKLPLVSDVALSSMVLEKKLEPLAGEDGPTYLKKLLGDSGYLALQKFKSKFSPLIAKLHTGATAIDAETLKLKDISFADFISREKLPKKVAEWIRISVSCEAGTEWTKISALDGLAEFHIFVGEGEKSYRVIGGNQKFTDAFSKAIGSDHISLSTRVNRIVSKGEEKVSVYYLDQTQNVSGVIEASYVISTIPLFRLFEVQFEPALSAKKRESIATQGWGAYFKAHVLLQPTAEKYWTSHNRSILPILSDSNLGVIYEGNPSLPDQRSRSIKTKILSLLVIGNYAEAFNMLPLDQVRTQVSKGLDQLWPGISKEIKGIEFYRYHPRAIAAWPPGRSRFDALSDEIRRPENNVILAGDFTESSHSDGAFVSSTRAVQQILKLKNMKYKR